MIDELNPCMAGGVPTHLVRPRQRGDVSGARVSHLERIRWNHFLCLRDKSVEMKYHGFASIISPWERWRVEYFHFKLKDAFTIIQIKFDLCHFPHGENWSENCKYNQLKIQHLGWKIHGFCNNNFGRFYCIDHPLVKSVVSIPQLELLINFQISIYLLPHFHEYSIPPLWAIWCPQENLFSPALQSGLAYNEPRAVGTRRPREWPHHKAPE